MRRIVRMLAPNPSVYTLEGTNTWVVGRGPAIVIDPGPADDEHLREVAREAGPVAHVLVTHDHEDHAEGAVAFGASVGAPVHAWRVEGAEPLHDGDVFHAGGVALTAVHTPGHSADHVAFHDADEASLFTGDAVLGRGTSFIDPPDGDLAMYLASLERMASLTPRIILPGHGPIVLDAQARLRHYLAHRAERERQIADLLAAGPSTVDELVSRIYADQSAAVWPLAARSVLAHLQKLRTEGRAEKAGRGKAQTWSAIEPGTCERCGREVRGRERFCSSCSVGMLQDAAKPDG
jgi:glyoxylase-like metal-dependent hydrolase (beta-lactamase superfamily II)